MAISSTAVWEMRTAGNDANGGMYDASLSGAGTDYSQQDSAQLSVTDAVTTSSTTVTSATGGFTSAMIGNGINIAGTIYVITARASTTSITVDRSTGTGTGQTAKVGGALLTLSKVAPLVSDTNKIYIKGGTYNQASTVTASNASSVVLIGYTSSRGDNGVATLKATAGSIDLLTRTNNSGGWHFVNLKFDGNSQTSSRAISFGNQFNADSSVFLRCEILNWSTAPVVNIRAPIMVLCYVHDCNVGSSTNIIVSCGDQCGMIDRSVFYNCTGRPIDYGTVVTRSIFDTLTMEGLRFVTSQTSNIECTNNSFYSITGGGILVFDSFGRSKASGVIQNNVCESVTGVAIQTGSDVLNGLAVCTLHNNAFYSCGTNYVKYGGYVEESGTVTLSASPYTNASGHDFSLNNTAGGAACRAAGIPGAFSTGTMIGYPDIGAVQHQDPKTLLYRKRRLY